MKKFFIIIAIIIAYSIFNATESVIESYSKTISARAELLENGG